MSNIQNLINKKKKELETAKKQEVILPKKQTKYQINANNKDYNLLDFLQSFEFVENIKELVEGKYYAFEVKEKEDFELLKSVFSDYHHAIGEKINIKRSTKENFLYNDNPFVTEYSEFPSLEENILDYTNPYNEECVKQQDNYLNVDPNKLIEQLSKFIQTISENVTKEQADIFTQSVYQSVKKMHESNPTIGGYGSISDYQIIDINHNGNSELFMKGYKLRNKIKEVCDNINKNNEKNRLNSEKCIKKALREAKEKSDIKSIKLIGLKEWQDAYYGSDNEKEKKQDKLLREKLNKIDIPKCQSLSGMNPFEFFNYYNISEKDYSVEKPLIRELTSVFSAIHIAEYRNKVFNYFDEVLNKSNKYECIEDVIDNAKDISIQSFEKSLKNKKIINNIKRKI